MAAEQVEDQGVYGGVKLINTDDTAPAIETRFVGPTNHRGSRVLVRTETKRMEYTLPVALTWADTSTGRFRDTMPGRGDAGWTLYGFDTAEDRAAFMREHPHASMPCWRRIKGVFDTKAGE